MARAGPPGRQPTALAVTAEGVGLWEQLPKQQQVFDLIDRQPPHERKHLRCAQWLHDGCADAQACTRQRVCQRADMTLCTRTCVRVHRVWSVELPHGRHFIAASPPRFYDHYRQLRPDDRHFYEVIRAGEPCHLYFGARGPPAYHVCAFWYYTLWPL